MLKSVNYKRQYHKRNQIKFVMSISSFIFSTNAIFIYLGSFIFIFEFILKTIETPVSILCNRRLFYYLNLFKFAKLVFIVATISDTFSFSKIKRCWLVLQVKFCSSARDNALDSLQLSIKDNTNSLLSSVQAEIYAW